MNLSAWLLSSAAVKAGANDGDRLRGQPDSFKGAYEQPRHTKQDDVPQSPGHIDSP